MKIERAQVGWGFWLRWVLASTMGLTVGFAVGLIMLFVGAFMLFAATLEFDETLTLTPVMFATMLAAAVGASVGIAQWLVLRWWQVSRAGWWVLASAVGAAVGGAAGAIVISAATLDFAEVVGETLTLTLTLTPVMLILVTMFGASVGIAQWLVLRRQVSRSGWWVLASIVGFAVGVAVSIVVDRVVGFAVYGAITGGVMVWLLRQPVTEETSLPQEATETEGRKQSATLEPSVPQDAAEPDDGVEVTADNTEREQVGWGFWRWWVLASTVGLGVGLVVGGAVVGASLGIAQWLVLRQLGRASGRERL